MSSRAVLTTVVLAWSVARPAAAQTADVGLIADRDSADEAFLHFVPVPDEHRFAGMEDARHDAAVAFVVDLQGADGVVRIWRRSDRATLERRLEGPDPEGYALAVMGSELLEVARAGSMVEVVSVDPPAPEEAAEPPAPEAARPEPPSAPEGPDPEAPAEAAGAPGPVSFTVGAALEGWFSSETGGPWLVQPALAFELGYSPPGEDWQLGVGLFGAGLGQLDRRVGDVELHYQRYDAGVRLTVGGAFGPVGTRLFGHARLGASAVVGRAEDEGEDDNPREGSRTLAGGFVGPSLEARQPIVEGLELTLELGVDVLIEPVRFLADSVTLVVESPLRLSGRLGLAYRVE